MRQAAHDQCRLIFGDTWQSHIEATIGLALAVLWYWHLLA